MTAHRRRTLATAAPATPRRAAGHLYANKAELADPAAPVFELPDHKTMHGGKHIAEGDRVYVFASGKDGGAGLVARGAVRAAVATPRRPGVARQTPRVSIVVERSATARRPLGRRELKPWSHGPDGRPETELYFKFYRQATGKIVGLMDATADFLDGFF